MIQKRAGFFRKSQNPYLDSVPRAKRPHNLAKKSENLKYLSPYKIFFTHETVNYYMKRIHKNLIFIARERESTLKGSNKTKYLGI
jgi:hypothetical protein